MNEQGDFALVPRRPSAVEKAKSGAKRILSGMITDTIAIANAQKPSKSRIVLVDAEPLILQVIEMTIQKSFNDVTLLAFSNSIEAAKELALTDPNLLITDNIMPELGGEEIVRRLLKRNIRYPVVMMSGWEPTERFVQEMASQGFDVTFLRKPFKSESLLRIVETSLKIQRRPERRAA